MHVDMAQRGLPGDSDSEVISGLSAESVVFLIFTKTANPNPCAHNSNFIKEETEALCW